MRIFFLFLALCASSGCLAGEAPFQVALSASAALDFYSGVRLNPGNFREVNPLLGQNRAVQASITAASTGGALYLSQRLYRGGKKKTAILLLIGGTALHTFGAAHNFRLGGK